jgi:hypothetical protein
MEMGMEMNENGAKLGFTRMLVMMEKVSVVML